MKNKQPNNSAESEFFKAQARIYKNLTRLLFFQIIDSQFFSIYGRKKLHFVFEACSNMTCFFALKKLLDL
jgi:hypothetical protein